MITTKKKKTFHMNQKNICYFSWEISFFTCLHIISIASLAISSFEEHDRKKRRKKYKLLISHQKNILIVQYNRKCVSQLDIISEKIQTRRGTSKNEQITVGNFPNKQSDFIFSLNMLSRYAVFLWTIHTAF